MSPVLAVLVSAALALGPAPARLPDRFEDLEAHVQDLAGQKKYRELALAGAAAYERRDLEPYQRRAMAFFAIRGLHGVYEETGQVTHLCDAGRLMRRVRTEVGFSEDAGAATRLSAATAKLLARTGTKDPCSKSRPAKTSPPAVAVAPPSPAAIEPAPTDPGPHPAVPAMQEISADDELLPVAPRIAGRKEHVAKDTSHRTHRDSSRPPARGAVGRSEQDAVRSDRLLHGGLAALALGAVGSVGLGVSLHYQRRASDTIDVLRASAEGRGYSTPDEYAQARDLNESFRSLRVAASVSAALAALGVLGAVTLFAVRARKGTTLAGPWIGPAGAGLSIRGRF